MLATPELIVWRFGGTVADGSRVRTYYQNLHAFENLVQISIDLPVIRIVYAEQAKELRA